ncbi:uncharacterized protein LOC118478950 [Aplysia californica]|uniref:Uncharacterized protein LOC118478950 n=1 Tax=Aplysia californica TaxID=6500 RepID=A0ABM1W3Y3_APLCA|nr:uncharacterized protein LOC118478950 [Aplysia californica]
MTVMNEQPMIFKFPQIWKGWPQQLNKANTDKMAPGEIKAMTKRCLLSTVFNDKRKVSVLSTNSSPGVSTVTRRVKGGVQHIEIPNSVLNYNNHMFGVDLADQLHSYYAVGRSGVKWLRYVLWFVVTPETPYGCSICKVHLHKGLCFASFHKELASAQ